MQQIILPSIMAKSQKELNANCAKLKDVVKVLHLDIVDGKFAKNKTFQFPFRLNKNFKYNVHLMVKNPEKWIEKNWRRVDLIIPHFEELKDIERYAKWMKNRKKKVAFAILPETKVRDLKKSLPFVNYVLVLTVKPGYYGSKFLPKELKKIAIIKKINPKVKVIVDGGMSPETIEKTKKAGADYFVSGSYVTKSDKPKERIKNLIKKIKLVKN